MVQGFWPGDVYEAFRHAWIPQIQPVLQNRAAKRGGLAANPRRLGTSRRVNIRQLQLVQPDVLLVQPPAQRTSQDQAESGSVCRDLHGLLQIIMFAALKHADAGAPSSFWE